MLVLSLSLATCSSRTISWQKDRRIFIKLEEGGKGERRWEAGEKWN